MQLGISFEQIAATVGRHKVWCASALLGQQSMSAEEAQRVIDLLGLDQEIASPTSALQNRKSHYFK